jgi:hypothetical protein
MLPLAIPELMHRTDGNRITVANGKEIRTGGHS